jgi:hypothetical protein
MLVLFVPVGICFVCFIHPPATNLISTERGTFAAAVRSLYFADAVVKDRVAM